MHRHAARTRQAAHHRDPPTDRLAWCRQFQNAPLFDPLAWDKDARVYYELRHHPEFLTYPPPIPPSDVLAFWRFALRCRDAIRRLDRPWARPTQALDFLKWLEESLEARRLIEWYGEKAHPILMALWFAKEYREEPQLQGRKRSTIAMRRTRGTPPKPLEKRITLNIPGLDQASVLSAPDLDTTKYSPGRPTDAERYLFPPSIMGYIIADLWHKASKRRYRGWSTIEALLGVSRRSVLLLRADQDKHRRARRILRDKVLPATQDFLKTGLL